MDDLANKVWYVVKTKPQQNQRAKDNLARLGHNVFSPYRNVSLNRANKIITKRQLAFPGYLFVNIDQRNRQSINSTFGVSYLLCDGFKKPLAVKSKIMKQLFENCSSDGELTLDRDLQPGDKVRIFKGPLLNSLASISTLKDNDKALVFLQLMGQFSSVQISRSSLEKVG